MTKKLLTPTTHQDMSSGKKTMKILIFGGIRFPNGLAPAPRIIAYAKGLIKNGVDAQVICFKALERPENGMVNTEPKGIYDGIPFEYLSGTTFRPNSFWMRRWLEIKAIAKLFRYFDAGIKPDATIFFSNYGWTFLTLLLFKLMGVKCIEEDNEYPFVYEKKTWWVKLNSAFYHYIRLKLYDGVIVISTFLEEYYISRVRKGAGVLRIPILVDTDQIKPGEFRQLNGRRNIVYAGTLSHPGEVSSLIKSFSILTEKYPEWNLQILGDAPKTDMLARMRNLAEQLALSERIEFTGIVKRDEMPVYLGKAGVLALLRPSGIFSTAGFPTKLGEYLATGKPVVVTRVGDIPLFLEDGVSAFLVKPDDPEAFAQKLDEVFGNYDQALQVGQRGREVAIREFNILSNCKKIVEFVKRLQGQHQSV
jgi:glycosyltransferase involved in cell wall biosynthesis